MSETRFRLVVAVDLDEAIRAGCIDVHASGREEAQALFDILKAHEHINGDVELVLRTVADDLYEVALEALAYYRAVYEWRNPDGSVPLNTVDYYALEDRIKRVESLTAEARGEVSP